MATLELTGRYYHLYLEGERRKELNQLSFGLDSETGRECYGGFGRITRHDEQSGTLFPFLTEPTEGVGRLDQVAILTPVEFEQFNGLPRTAVLRIIEDGPQTLIDALSAMTLDTIERWRAEELTRKRSMHRILLPPPIVFGRVSRELVQIMLSAHRAATTA